MEHSISCPTCGQLLPKSPQADPKCQLCGGSGVIYHEMSGNSCWGMGATPKWTAYQCKCVTIKKRLTKQSKGRKK